MPAMIAHRGAAHDAPENTLAAFELAWRQGADGIEGDFRLTRDGAVVCIHDADTRRTAGEAATVAEATLAELRRLDVGRWKGERWRGARIPTIDEVLAAVPGQGRVFLEIKCGPEILPPLAAALAASRVPSGQLVVVSFHESVVAEAKRLLPRVKALWLTDFEDDRKTGAVRPSPETVLETLARTAADGVGCSAHPAVDPALAQALRAARKELHVWTVDDVAAAERFVRLGVDSLTSNRAGWLKRQLGMARAGQAA